MKFAALCLTGFFYLVSPLVSASDTKIYHWVDEDGKIHFSDTAVPGTEQLSISEQSISSDKKEKKQSTNSTVDELSLDEPLAQEQENITYQATITSPEDDKALRSNDGSIDIHVITEPEKENTQKFQLYLDGKALGEPQISSTMRALNIDRGTHQVRVHLLDENGKVLAKTQVVTVHLQRATVR